LLQSRLAVELVLTYLGFAMVLTLSDHTPLLAALMPDWLAHRVAGRQP
jgi:hypothetical protein